MNHTYRYLSLFIFVLMGTGLIPLIAQAGGWVFVPNTFVDEVDADIGDGCCETAHGECSLRAAVQEANFRIKTVYSVADPSALGEQPTNCPGVSDRSYKFPDNEVLIQLSQGTYTLTIEESDDPLQKTYDELKDCKEKKSCPEGAWLSEFLGEHPQFLHAQVNSSYGDLDLLGGVNIRGSGKGMYQTKSGSGGQTTIIDAQGKFRLFTAHKTSAYPKQITTTAPNEFSYLDLKNALGANNSPKYKNTSSGGIMAATPILIKSCKLSGMKGNMGGVIKASDRITVDHSVFEGNETGSVLSADESDALEIHDSTFAKNTSSVVIYTWANKEVVIKNSVIDDNIGYGVLLSFNSFQLIDSTISNNSKIGVHVYPSGKVLVIDGSTISGNQMGGVNFVGDEAKITNTTISGNSQYGYAHDERSIINTLMAGDKYDNVPPRTSTLVHVTIAGNNVGLILPTEVDPSNQYYVDGKPVYIKKPGRKIIVQNSILGNTGADCLGGPIISEGNNIYQKVKGCVLEGKTSSDKKVSPQYYPLADNGGRTQTHALAPTSPAIDAANNETIIGAVLKDQRGYTRPIQVIADEPISDIGAFEVQPEPGDLENPPPPSSPPSSEPHG